MISKQCQQQHKVTNYKLLVYQPGQTMKSMRAGGCNYHKLWLLGTCSLTYLLSTCTYRNYCWKILFLKQAMTMRIHTFLAQLVKEDTTQLASLTQVRDTFHNMGPGNLVEKLQLASYIATVLLFNPLSHCLKEMPLFELSVLMALRKATEVSVIGIVMPLY